MHALIIFLHMRHCGSFFYEDHLLESIFLTCSQLRYLETIKSLLTSDFKLAVSMLLVLGTVSPLGPVASR